MKKICAFTISDVSNEPYLDKFVKSLRKFHTEDEVPLTIVGQKWLDTIKDPDKFYRMTPMIARDLLKEYETVIKFDCDQIITSKLDHIINDPQVYDVGTVYNDLPLRVWDCPFYYNCGLVVMKSREFVEHWWRLCKTPHFQGYQFREQDLLSLLCSDYHNYKVKCYDEDGQTLNGLVAKPGWASAYMKDGSIYMKTPMGERKLTVIHFAGGSGSPDKGNYRIRFVPGVVSYIEGLIK